MHHWFPVKWSDRIKTRPLGVTLNGIPLVLFRSKRKVMRLQIGAPTEALHYPSMMDV